MSCLIIGLHYHTFISVKVRVVCGTVYEDKHYIELLGSISRVRYFFLSSDIYCNVAWTEMQKIINGLRVLCEEPRNIFSLFHFHGLWDDWGLNCIMLELCI